MKRKTGPMPRDPMKRLMEMVELTESGCWVWSAYKDHPERYPRIGLDRDASGEKRREKAHRFSYRMFKGDIPAGLFVCHKCDVRICVNPDHLFLGTQTDNMSDCAAKKRLNYTEKARGEKNAMTKLTADDVRAIRASQESSTELAGMYGCTSASIRQIIRKKTWRHIS